MPSTPARRAPRPKPQVPQMAQKAPSEASAAKPSGPAIVEVRSLGKTFGKGGKAIKAVDGVDIAVRKGEVFAFLGPNGAGKSTTIKMLCTLLKPTAGTASIAGHDCESEPRDVR